MDNFAEQLVKKEQTSSDAMKKAMIYSLGILLTITLLMLVFFSNGIVSFIIVVLAAGTAYGMRSLAMRLNIEYEYTVTNGELDIDKIIAQSKRTRLITVYTRRLTAFGKYSEDIPESEELTVVLASDNIASHEYYADANHNEHGKVRIIFSPDTKMLSIINIYLPSKLRLSKSDLEKL